MENKKVIKYSEKIGLTGVYLFAFSLMISKFGTNLGLGLMILGSLFFIKDLNINKIETEKKLLIFLLILYPIFSLLSPGGVKSSLIALDKTYRYFSLLFIPVFLNKEKEILNVINCICFSVIINFINGMKIYSERNWNLKLRYESFGNNLLDDAHMFAMLSFLILAFIVYCIINKKLKFLILPIPAYILALSGLLLSQTRGAWLSLIGGLGIFIFLCIKNKKMIIAVIISCLLSGIVLSKTEYLKNNYYVNRFKSIKNINDDSPKIRLLMWQGAMHTFKENLIFGAGRDNSPKYILEYLEKNNKYDEVHNKKMLRDIAETGNAHNMYFTSISEEGILSLFLFAFWGMIFFNEILLLKKLKNKNLYYILIGCISLTCAFYITGLTENAWRNIWKTNTFLMGVSIYLVIKKMENKMNKKVYIKVRV